MALTAEQRSDYHDVIQAVFNGTVPSQPNQVNDEVARIVDRVIEEIYQCSKNLAVAEALVNFWVPAGSFGGLTRTARQSLTNAFKNLNQVESGNAYAACANAARLNWRSPLTIALLGI